MKKLIVSSVLSVITSMTFAQAQQPATRMATLAGGLEVGVPVGEFSDTWGHQLVGLSGNITFPMRRIPLSYGFDFGWSHMGGSSRQVDLHNPAITATTGKLSVSSDVYSYHGMIRLQPYQGKVSPYVDGMLGFRHFVTKSKVEVDNLSQPVETQRQESSAVGSMGLAFGAYYAPTRNFVCELRVERLSGGKVEYVDP
ncbi:MAG TPA: hypothetical protein PK760_13080, partial [Flavobacteriales bacterium]|nr:hypothetical protein [Flavobacteriales bacterium]